MDCNEYKIIIYENEPCIEFITKGKYAYKVLVDKDVWFNYIQNFSWTGQKSVNRMWAKTSIDKQSKQIHRVIIEYVKDELDYLGATIDHINNNPLDNRLKNLRICNTILLNTTNIDSKYRTYGMQYIYKQANIRVNGERVITAYKLHYNIGGETTYKNFSIKEYGNIEDAKKAAIEYRDNDLDKRKEKEMMLIKKCRDIEFERGLRDKIAANETDEIWETLVKYGIVNSK